MNIGYHTRLKADNTVKCVGGYFGGSFDLQTVNRLVKAHFSVVMRPSGSLVFVDRVGREVSLYFTVDPRITDAGKSALEAYAKIKRKQQEDEQRKQDQLDALLDSMTLDDALARLR